MPARVLSLPYGAFVALTVLAAEYLIGYGIAAGLKPAAAALSVLRFALVVFVAPALEEVARFTAASAFSDRLDLRSRQGAAFYYTLAMIGLEAWAGADAILAQSRLSPSSPSWPWYAMVSIILGRSPASLMHFANYLIVRRYVSRTEAGFGSTLPALAITIPIHVATNVFLVTGPFTAIFVRFLDLCCRR